MGQAPMPRPAKSHVLWSLRPTHAPTAPCVLANLNCLPCAKVIWQSLLGVDYLLHGLSRPCLQATYKPSFPANLSVVYHSTCTYDTYIPTLKAASGIGEWWQAWYNAFAACPADAVLLLSTRGCVECCLRPEELSTQIIIIKDWEC